MKRIGSFPGYLRIGTPSVELELKSYALETNDNRTLYVYDAPVISLLSELLGFKFEILHPPDGPFGNALPDGNWTGMIGMMQRGEIDIAIGKLSISEERSEIVDYSYPYQFSHFTFITDKQKFLPNMFAIFHPFSLTVWVAIAFSLTILLLFSYLLRSKTKSFGSILLEIFGSLLEEVVNLKIQKMSSKLLLLSWIIGAMFLTYSYKALLLSFLTFPTATVIHDFPELAKATEDDSFKCSTYPGSLTYTILLDSDNENLRKIGQCLTRSKKFTVDVEGFFKPSSYKKAFIGSYDHMATFHRDYFVSDDYFSMSMRAVAVQKSFCCKRSLGKVIHEISAAGLFEKFFRDEEFFLELVNSASRIEQSNQNRKLTVEDFAGAFIVLVAGHALAFAVFLLEVFLGRNRKNHKGR